MDGVDNRGFPRPIDNKHINNGSERDPEQMLKDTPQGSVDKPENDWRSFIRFKRRRRSTPSSLHELQISWEDVETFGTTFGALYCLVVFIC